MPQPSAVEYQLSPPLTDMALNRLFAAAWPGHVPRSYEPVLQHSLVYVCAFAGDELIGFMNLAWDGQSHAFVLDPTVHPAWRLKGIGQELVERAAHVAAARGVEWLHVDYEPRLKRFYERCGFRPSAAGVRRLRLPP
jgi:GNAT superfamily N-acetyltransferase